MKNYLVFGITGLISASAFFLVAGAATIGRNGRAPRLTLSMAAQSRSAIQSMREFAIYMGPKGLRGAAEESSRQRMLDLNLISPRERQMLVDDENLPQDLKRQLVELQAGNPTGGIRCRIKAGDAAGSDSNSEAEFADCSAFDEYHLGVSGASDQFTPIQCVFSIIMVPILLL